MKKSTMFLVAATCCLVGTSAFAVLSGIGGVAGQVTGNLSNVAKLITAASYVAGMGLTVGAIAKFKAHKDNPTSTNLGVPVSLLFIGASMLFAPSVFKAGGGTLYGASGSVSTVSGITSFGVGAPSSKT